MVEINVNPDDKNSPIEFFPSKRLAVDAIRENKDRFTGWPRWRKHKLWTTWYIHVAGAGYLREDGSVY